jgi:hypothetical protein
MIPMILKMKIFSKKASLKLRLKNLKNFLKATILVKPFITNSSTLQTIKLSKN